MQAEQPIATANQAVPMPEPSNLNADIIRQIRNSVDKTSWGALDENLNDSGAAILKINKLNSFLIESFDTFVIRNLPDIFKNRRIRIKHGWIELEAKLESPKKDGRLFWPNEARLGKENYVGSLLVRGTIYWEPSSGKSTPEFLTADWIELAKIPIMVGSCRCNLRTLNTKEELNEKKECSENYMGYFIIGGNERVLISQNYLKPDDEHVISSKMGSSTPKTVCNIRSRGKDWIMHMITVFIMSGGPKKFTHGDRRIFVKFPFVKRNIHDKSSEIVVGLNIVSVFRIAIIAVNYMNPFAAANSYDFATGFGTVSTYKNAVDEFHKYMLAYAGPDFYQLIKNYVESTTNEASMEENERTFWDGLLKAGSNDPTKKTIESFIPELLTMFGEQFYPHISSAPHNAQRDLVRNIRREMRNSILALHQGSQYFSDAAINNDREARNNLVDESLFMYERYINGNNEEMKRLYQVELLKRNVIPRENVNEPETIRDIRHNLDVNFESAMIYYNTIKKENDDKLRFTAYMALRVLRVEMGADICDNRDSPAKQVYDDAGMLMTSRFASMVGELSRSHMANYDSVDAKQILTHLVNGAKNIITKSFNTNFAENTWNSWKADKPRHGVTDILPSSVTVAKISYLRRLSAFTKGHSSNSASREISGLQAGGVCPAETPEGQQCGNVEHLASAAFITNESTDVSTMAVKLNMLKSVRRGERPDYYMRLNPEGLKQTLDDLNNQTHYISDMPTEGRTTPFFVNGRPFGWTDGRIFRNVLIQMRRNGYLHPHAGIHYSMKNTKTGVISYVKIETSPGRVVQPLIIVDNDPNVTFKYLIQLHQDLHNNRPWSLPDMIAKQFVEYVDHAELESLVVAISVSDFLRSIQEGQPKKYDHIMLNPAFLMGVSANVMPFANMNPPVRNSYFTQMVKQPADVPEATVIDRAYTAGVARLFTPQEPLVKTDMYQVVLNKTQFVKNLRVLIAAHRDGQEDGIIVNQRMLDNGVLGSAKLDAYPIVLEPGEELDFGEGFSEKQEDFGRYGKGIIRTTERFVSVDPETGKAKIETRNVEVRPSEILARKVWVNSESQISKQDLVYESLRTGIVEKIVMHKNSDKHRIYYIIIKHLNELGLGDKIASRYSQKGVIVKVLPNELMPYVQDTGETADMILNPQAFPSRMTIGMAAEMLVGTAYVSVDPFKRVTIQYTQFGMDVFAGLSRLFVLPDGVIISSEEIYDDNELVANVALDTIPKVPELNMPNGLLVFTYYDNEGLPKYIAPLFNNSTNLESLNMMVKVITYRQDPAMIEAIPGLFADANRTSSIYGLRISRMPEEIREIYLAGNKNTPIPTQYIADYKPDEFFTMENLMKHRLDFIIPDSELTIRNIRQPDDNELYEWDVPAGITPWKKLQEDTTMLSIYDPTTATTRDYTLIDAWLLNRNMKVQIPRANVILLPANARGLYEKREEKINSLRQATIFKEDIDVKDAQEELELMGMNRDMKSTFINPETGEPITNALVMGWSSYMVLKHKVKDKVQARGEGGRDQRTHQPGQGRMKGGGIKFGNMDGSATARSRAYAFLSNRLLDASAKSEVYVCTACSEICSKESRNAGKMGAVICPLCKDGNRAVKMSLPYTFILYRRLMMGAGVRMKIHAEAIDSED